MQKLQDRSIKSQGIQKDLETFTQKTPCHSPKPDNKQKKLILVIEDEKDIQELIHFNLSQQGFDVILAEDGQKGVFLCQTKSPDLVLLDIMLPKLDGYEVCKQIAQKLADQTDSSIGIPIIMLTAKSEESDIIQGLNLGADDYITKPFSPKELIARVKAHLRRYEQYNLSKSLDLNDKNRDCINFKALKLYPKRHIIYLYDQPLILTLSEFRLLSALIKSPGQVFSRAELISQIVEKGITLIDRNIDVHILSIRKKLGKHSDIIQTVRGVGYKCPE